MSILSTVEGSVLWLLEEHPCASPICALKPKPVVLPPSASFSQSHALEDHLARLKLADLVLDTLPYGAHNNGKRCPVGGGAGADEAGQDLRGGALRRVS